MLMNSRSCILRNVLSRRSAHSWITGLLIAVLSFQVAAEKIIPSERQEIRDLHYGLALFDAHQENYYSAIVDILASREQRYLEHQIQDSQLLLAELYVTYGLYAEAEAALRSFIKNRDSSINKNISPAELDQAWFYLGKLYYHKRLFKQAKNAFAKVGNDLATSLHEEFYTLRANLLMREGAFSQAAASLQQITAAVENQDFYYARYNLGISYIKAGDQRQGVDILRELGRLQTNDSELKKLRDKANLTLGLHILRRAPVIARDFLRRIRLDGQYSNRALLGLGWAEVERGNYDVALLPLKKLSQRGGADTAVYESMLVIGQILERMRAMPQAVQAYQEAISIFQQELKTLDDTAASLKVSDNFAELLTLVVARDAQHEQGWTWEARSLPATQEARYLFPLMAGHEFHEGVKNLRDLTGLMQKLELWQEETPLFEYLASRRSELFTAQLNRLKPDVTLLRMKEVQSRRDLFAADLKRIETEKDVFALVDKQEQDFLARLADVEQAIQTLPGKKAIDYRERHRLLKGLLSYQVEIDFERRLKKAMNQLQDINALLEQTLASKVSLQRARDETPGQLSSLRRRVGQQRPRILELQDQTRKLIEVQKQQLQILAEQNLLKLREKLVIYLDKARLSLAYLQDTVIHAKQFGQDPSGEPR